MNRIIKFRLRIKGQKGFQYVSLDDFIKDYGLSEQLCTVKVLSRDQFTGVKDDNGKEIYKGDIVKAKGDEWAILEVKWHPDRGFYILSVVNSVGWWNFPLPEMEIIGNIYQNKELLK